LLRPNDPFTGAVYLEQAYERFPKDQAIQQMLAELAFAAGRPDRTVAVCRTARTTDPQSHWASKLEAAACLVLGRPTQALEALAPIRADLVHDAAGMELYTRAACAVGAEVSIDEILREKINATADASGYLGVARGFLAVQRPGDAARSAKVIIDRFPDHVQARWIHAEALAQLAEAGDSLHWPAEKVREALSAYEWLRQREADNRQIAERMAWLQLKGLEAPALALRSAAPLRKDGTALTPQMNETLGAVLSANAEIAEAVRFFDVALERAPGRASSYIGRAEARWRLGGHADASSDLQRAASLPRSPRQTAEWQRVAKRLRGEQ
jgi:predicted Zn-dependent protease